jgi:uncharacterized repeat protein (TIGR01451 family)
MKKLLLLVVILFAAAIELSAQVTVVRPNVGYRGQTLTTTITISQFSPGASSPPLGYQDIYLQQGGTIIYTYNQYSIWTNVYYNTGFPFGAVFADSLWTNFDIPVNAPLGLYDVHVVTYDIFGGVPSPTDQVLLNGFEVKNPAGTVEGTVYFDGNQNGIFDVGEFPLPNHWVTSSPSGSLALTDQNGEYILTSDTGTIDVGVFVPAGYTQTSSPTTYNLSIPPSYTGKDFGLFSASQVYFQYASIFAPWPRCLTTSSASAHILNSGFLPTNGSVSVWFSSNASNISSQFVPDFMLGDTMVFNYSNLQPNTTAIPGGTLTYTAPAAGQVVTIHMIDSVFDTNNNFINVNIDSVYMLIRCSYDPNDKTAIPEGSTAAHYTPIGNDVEYIIRFQNTGNDDAYDIFIYDTLDAAYDPMTLQIIGSSHNMNTQVETNGAMKFSFYNIFLPDSGSDEPGSHGWLRYRIHARAGIPDPTVVENTAYIVFDQNDPVITNTTRNTLTALQFPVANFSTAAPTICESSCIDFTNLSSNGTSYTWIFTGSNISTTTNPDPTNICYPTVGAFDVTLVATNALGSDSMTQSSYINVIQGPVGLNVIQSGDTLIAPAGYATYQWYFNNNPIVGATSEQYFATANGDYALSVTNANGCSAGLNISNFSVGVDALSLNGGGMIVYPNPSSGSFEVRFTSSDQSIIQIEVIDKIGQLVVSKTISATIGQNTVSFDELDLSSGIYMIKLKTNERLFTKMVSINK